MDPQAFFNVVGGGALAALGWFARTLYAAIEGLKSDFGEHKVDVAKTYATRLDLIRFEEKLDKILTKVEAKADK